MTKHPGVIEVCVWCVCLIGDCITSPCHDRRLHLVERESRDWPLLDDRGRVIEPFVFPEGNE